MPIDRQNPHALPAVSYRFEPADAIRLLLYGLLIFTPLARGSVQGWAITVIHITTLAMVTLLGTHFIWKWQWHWIATPLDRPLALLMVLILVSTAFSQHLPISLEAIALLLNYIIIFYLTIHITQYRSRLRHLVYVIIGIAVFLAVFGLVKESGYNPFPWWEYPELRQGTGILVSTYGNRNHTAGYLEMAVPLALGMLLIGQKPGKLAFLTYLAGLLITALIMTLSRGGWFSTGISLIFMAGALLQNPYYEHKKSLGFGMAVIVFILLIVFANTEVVDRILTMTENDLDLTLDARVIAWKASLSMITDHPIVGTGPGTFSLAFTPYHPPGYSSRFFEAHNDYLHIVAEIGLVQVPVMIWLVVAVYRKGFKKLKNPSRLVRGITIGALSGITAILCHSVVDFNLHIPANALVFTVLAGIVAGPVPGRKKQSDA